MTPGTGVLVLGCGYTSHTVKMHYFLENVLLYTQAQIRKLKYSNNDQGFLCWGIVIWCKRNISSPLLYSQEQIRQTKYIVMMTKEGSTKIVTYMNPGAHVFVLGLCQRHEVKMQYFLSSTLGHGSDKLSMIHSFTSEQSSSLLRSMVQTN